MQVSDCVSAWSIVWVHPVSRGRWLSLQCRRRQYVRQCEFVKAFPGPIGDRTEPYNVFLREPAQEQDIAECGEDRRCTDKLAAASFKSIDIAKLNVCLSPKAAARILAPVCPL